MARSQSGITGGPCLIFASAPSKRHTGVEPGAWGGGPRPRGGAVAEVTAAWPAGLGVEGGGAPTTYTPTAEGRKPCTTGQGTATNSAGAASKWTVSTAAVTP